MPSARRRALNVMLATVAALALAAGVAAPGAPAQEAPPAPTASGQTLQVTPEVTEVAPDADRTVALTATLSADAGSGGVDVNFRTRGGPGTFRASQCQVKEGEKTCVANITSAERGSSEVVAWIEGTTPDGEEARIADTGPLGDCGLELLGSQCEGTAHAGAVPEPDATDVVVVGWRSFAAARLDCVDDDPSDGPDVEYDEPDERRQTYRCQLTDVAGTAPLGAAVVRWKIVDGLGARAEETPDGQCAGETDADGRCTAEIILPVDTSQPTGEATVCFWADGDADGVYDADSGADDVDGGACRKAPAVGDATDRATVNLSPPFPSRLQITPEAQDQPRGTPFAIRAAVYDQFGSPVGEGVAVTGELFEFSAGDADGNTPESPDLTGCATTAEGVCAVSVPTQVQLGTNLACFWIGAEAPDPMFGNPVTESQCGSETSSDQSPEDTVPPVGRAQDIIRFGIKTAPVLAAVAPADQRQSFEGVLRITGTDFEPDARVTLSGSGVRVGITRVVSATLVEADVVVAPDAPAGPRDVSVVNRDLGRGTCARCFSVIGQGYWAVASDGGIFAFGESRFAGSAGDRPLNQPIVAMAATPSGQGYWMVASDGGVFAFGDAGFHGSTGDVPLNRPIVGIAAHPGGEGYWLVASDGGIFAYGDARFYGSTARLRLTKPIVAIAPSPSGRGYTLVGADGGVFPFGDAKFHGSTAEIVLAQPITSMSVTPTGKGYWLVASDGGIFAYGDAIFRGSTGDVTLNKPIVAMASTPTGKGYWLVASDGGIFAFGDAEFKGSTGDIRLNQPIVGFARR